MNEGGNPNINEFFVKYKLPENTAIELKYKTKAARYYREKLKALTDETEFYGTEPDEEFGQEICEELTAQSPPKQIEGI